MRTTLGQRQPPPDDNLGTDTLYAIIGAVAKGPDLERVLPAVVELLSEATDCHACFVYLLEQDTLRMRAASSVFSRLVGEISMGVDEGLCGWVVRHREPAFIQDNAVADPRMKFFPELEEERFQSMIAVPLLVEREKPIGVVVLHTEAPREFSREVVDFLVHVASLIAGAIHNAHLYEEARLRARRLSELNELGQRIAAVDGRAALYRTTCEGVLDLLGAGASELLLVDREDSRLVPVAGAGSGGGAALSARLGAGPEELGAFRVQRRGEPFGGEDARLLEAVANQLAMALQKLDLIERLTGENLIGDLFAALAEGRIPAAELLARAAHHDLSYPHTIAVAQPSVALDEGFAAAAERVAARLRRLVPGALVDAGAELARILLPISGATVAERLARIDAELERLAVAERLAIGRSESRAGLGEGDRSLAEATHAAHLTALLRPAGGAAAYERLGAYRFLERPAGGPAPDQRLATAAATLRAYDRRRSGALTATLERYLELRGGVLATARALHIHPNTLRQRLKRIEELSGLRLAEEDLLSLELALKLAPLRDPVSRSRPVSQ